MQTYTLKEYENKYKQEFSDAIKNKLNQGHMITDTSGRCVRFNDKKVIEINHGMKRTIIWERDHNYTNDEVIISDYYELARNRFISADDYNEFIKPLKELRKKRQAKPQATIINKVPQSMIDRLKTIKGFKKVTHDNLMIMRFNEKIHLNCGTNTVLRYNRLWDHIELEEAYIEKGTFDYYYGDAKGDK